MKLTWTDVDTAVRHVVREVRAAQIDYIVGVARSGLIPAVHVAHLLNIASFGVIWVSRTISDAKDAPKTAPRVGPIILPADVDGRSVLVVDDIVGEGATIVAARRELESRGGHVTTCALAVNLNNLKGVSPEHLLDSFAIASHGWVEFPWCD